MMQTYSKEDFLCLTEEEKLALYLEQNEALAKFNEDLDIAQEGLLELQKELTLKRHAVEENEKLFALAKGLKEENEELKKNLPQAESVSQELESLKKRFEEETVVWQTRFQALEHEKQLILSEKEYLSELIQEYEREIERVKQELTIWMGQNEELQKEVEVLKQKMLITPNDDLKVELQKKEAEISALYSEVGKIKVIVVQGMKEAKELKTKYLTVLQSYEEINSQKSDQENLVIALQNKLHETTQIKNRLEQENKNYQGEVDKVKAQSEELQASYEKELQLNRQLLSKKTKEFNSLQENYESIDSSYQSKIQDLITDYQDRIESLQVQTQKLTREKESIESENLNEIKTLLGPILEKIDRVQSSGYAKSNRSHIEETSLIPDWKYHNESGVFTE